MDTFLHHRQLWVYLNPIAANTSCTHPRPYKGMRKANKAKTQSVLSVAIFRDFQRHFYQFSSLRYLYFYTGWHKGNFYDHFGMFFQKKADYIFVRYWKRRSILWRHIYPCSSWSGCSVFRCQTLKPSTFVILFHRSVASVALHKKMDY